MKRRLSIIAVVILLGNVLPVITNSFGGDVDQGKNLFDSKCMICHGVNGFLPFNCSPRLQ